MVQAIQDEKDTNTDIKHKKTIKTRIKDKNMQINGHGADPLKGLLNVNIAAKGIKFKK